MNNELYVKIICAILHNLDACESCKKCGKTSAEARMNIIKELAKKTNHEVPWYIEGENGNDDTKER